MQRLTGGPAFVASEWREGAAYRQLTNSLASGGDAEAVARAATQLFRDTGWVADLLDPLWAALAADPWFEPPLRVNRDTLRSGAILFETPAVAIGVAVLSAARMRTLPPTPTVVFSGRLGVTKYLRSGGARVRRWAADPVAADASAAAMGCCRALGSRGLADGQVVRQDGRARALLIEDASADVVTLTAAVRVGAAPVGREYDRRTGAFVRMATNDEGAARAQLLLSLLRTAGAAGANDAFERATHDPAFFLRWSAMREWLAHDWRAAWPRLEAMAQDDPHPEVRPTAAATLAQFAPRLAA